MKRLLLPALLLLLSVSATATHIVGGEFEFVFRGITSTGYHRYNLGMILYFDKRNGNPGALDGEVIVRVFRKRDNAVVINGIRLTLLENTAVQYKRPECASGGSVVTDRLFYSYSIGGTPTEYLFDPEEFNDSQGYYIAWERCCRNYTVTNIYSEDPNTGSTRYAGQTFYLEFPSMIKNGQPFTNSAPRLFKPLSDYACRGRLYTVDFQGVDPDGDSLVYSMVVPLNTLSGDALPPGDNLPRSGPYPNVTYRPGYSANNIMKGAPDMTISKRGILSVIPTAAGLFVFAVKVEEFRNKEKIGEIRRDFQLLVLANCPQATPPVVEGKTRGSNSFVKNQLVVGFDTNTGDDQRCIDIRVSDPDATSQSESIEILAIAVNFESEDLAEEILPPNPTAILKNGNSVQFSVCFPQCPYKVNSYVIDIIALNESCGGALMDTIRVDVRVDMPPNDPPVWSPDAVSATVTEGGAPYKVVFTGNDSDNDDMTIIPPVFAGQFATYGLAWQTTQDVAGKIVSELTWNTECDLYDFSKKRDFVFKFILDDNDLCDLTPNDTITFNLKRRIPDFHDPVIEYEPNKELEKITLSRKLYTSVDFNTLISDIDDDKLEVTGIGKGFNLADYGAQYPDETLTGNTSDPKTKPFTWWLDCNKIDINTKDKFDFYLIVTDKDNTCGYYLADTLDISLTVLPPDNVKPELFIKGSSTVITEKIKIGDGLSVPIMATDGDTSPKDNLTLELLGVNGTVIPEGYSFEPITGQSPVTSTFGWTPTCDIYKLIPNTDYKNEYKFTFKVTDDRCFVEEKNRTDTLSFRLIVEDVDSDTTFLPPNVITPNDDDKNEFFAMVALNDAGELKNILPVDNCAGRFVNIAIMNRWGRVVYESDNREFRWYAEGEPSGVYFYLLKFTNREFKGVVSVVTGSNSDANR
jgi:hypothetical protein